MAIGAYSQSQGESYTTCRLIGRACFDFAIGVAILPRRTQCRLSLIFSLLSCFKKIIGGKKIRKIYG